MSGRLFLPARVPNEGAHRLAHWMLGVRHRVLSETRIERARRTIGEVRLDRLLAGELTPGAEMDRELVALTGGRVRARDFYRATGRRWGDAPGWVAR